MFIFHKRSSLNKPITALLLQFVQSALREKNPTSPRITLGFPGHFNNGYTVLKNNNKLLNSLHVQRVGFVVKHITTIIHDMNFERRMVEGLKPWKTLEEKKKQQQQNR